MKLINQISNDRRCLFVLSGGKVGSGPLPMETGDKIYSIAGVPIPMALRRCSGRSSRTFIVIGAALVHGFMRGMPTITKLYRLLSLYNT